jgi:hypothetical protein
MDHVKQLILHRLDDLEKRMEKVEKFLGSTEITTAEFPTGSFDLCNVAALGAFMREVEVKGD